MRLLLLLSALCALGFAGWSWFLQRSSFSGYSGEQLDTIEAEIRSVGAEDPALAVQQQLIDRERTRRRAAPAAGLLGLLLLLAASLAPGPLVRRREDQDEAARLAAHIGDPQLLAEGKRHKAATLLGIAVGSSPEVIEAAYRAKLAEKDLSRVEGLAPDLQQMLRNQCEELKKARELLLERNA